MIGTINNHIWKRITDTRLGLLMLGLMSEMVALLYLFLRCVYETSRDGERHSPLALCTSPQTLRSKDQFPGATSVTPQL